MTKMLSYISVGLILIAVIAINISYRKRGGSCKISGFFSISHVTFSEFTESFPANGAIKNRSVVAEVDEIYFPRIKVGLNATSNDTHMIVTDVDSTIRDGRFSIKLKFNNSELLPPDGHSITFRIHLSTPIQTTLLPVGGFYKDTGGKWILVVKDSTHVVKRSISLGLNNADYFEVLSGLIPGEKVITSSYENYTRFDFRKPVTLADLKNLNY